MALESQPNGLAPGVYFGLSEDAYHADSAFSYSGIKDILVSPAVYWKKSVLNKKRREVLETNEAMLGKQMHLYVLQPEEFKEHYSLPGQALSRHKKVLGGGEYQRLQDAKERLDANDSVSTMMEGAAFEVSIFYIDPIYGIRMKTRHDIFKPFYSTDYKTTWTTTRRGVKSTILKFGYDIQNAVYRESRYVIREALKSGEAKVYGRYPQILMSDFKLSDKDSFFFIFQETEWPHYETLVDLSEGDVLHAMHKVTAAKELYVKSMEKYGPDTPWPPTDGSIQYMELGYNEDY